MKWIYTLLLSDNNYYVGFTENLEQRMEQHFNGEGAKWTQIHKPIKIIEVVPETNDWQEDFTTLVMMRKYGIQKVRGGRWCQVAPFKEVPENYDKIDPLRSLEENLFLVSKDTYKFITPLKKEEILKYFKEGKNEFQIAELLKTTEIEIESHIVDFVKNGILTCNDIGLTTTKVNEIANAIKKLNGDKSLLSIKTLCSRFITMNNIRYYVALF